jgi:aryl carrier-like protein
MPSNAIHSASYNAIYEELRLEASKLVGTCDFKPGDNLFAMGFDSISIIGLVSHIKTRYRVRLELRDLFEHPSLAQLAEEVARKRDSAE